MSGPIPLSLLPESATLHDGRLSIGGCDLEELAATHGTPLFVYDEAQLRNRCREAVAAFGDGVAYATKAFLCKAMARLAVEEGMWLDVATGGEMEISQAAGAPVSRMVLHGNNKSRGELAAGLAAGVGRVVIDSFDEMDLIDLLVDEGLPVPAVLVRITPGVEAHTHEFVRTGHDDTKFGFTLSNGTAQRAIDRARTSKSMNLVGLHAHIGSQVFRLGSFAGMAEVLGEFAARQHVSELSVGGGLGVAYVEGETAPTIEEWAQTVIEVCRQAGVTGRITAEPGRSIVAAAAVTVYRAGTIKELPGIRTYISVDGGMSDNPRPVLYGSGYETFLPRATDAARPRRVTVVGKHCESGDLLVKNGHLPKDIRVGDIIATPVTGAYGHSMGSNYNKVPRPAVVFCKDGAARLVVRRETVADLLATDLG